jgi:hypothetical protein
LFLLVGQFQSVSGHLHLQLQNQIALCARLAVGHALAGEPHFLARLDDSLVGDAQVAAVEGGDDALEAAERFEEGELDLVSEVVAVAAKGRVWDLLDDEFNVLCLSGGQFIAFSTEFDLKYSAKYYILACHYNDFAA